jgi:hypothetical protein
VILQSSSEYALTAFNSSKSWSMMSSSSRPLLADLWAAAMVRKLRLNPTAAWQCGFVLSATRRFCEFPMAVDALLGDASRSPQVTIALASVAIAESATLKLRWHNWLVDASGARHRVP